MKHEEEEGLGRVAEARKESDEGKESRMALWGGGGPLKKAGSEEGNVDGGGRRRWKRGRVRKHAIEF